MKATPKAPEPVIPQAPLLSMLAQQKMADPLKSGLAGRLLDWSEGRGNTGYEAHARGMHSGLEDSQLDARGKPVATSFLNDYDQNKALSTARTTAEGAGAHNKAVNGTGSYSAGFATAPTWDANADKLGGKNIAGYRTAPLARVAEQRSDGTYDHFNAKVTSSFLREVKDGTGTRVQTLYPNGYERLEAPANPAEMPEHVALDSLTDTDKLRHVEPEVKDKTPVGRVLSDEEVAKRKEEAAKAAAAKEEAARRAAAQREAAAKKKAAPKPQPNQPSSAPRGRKKGGKRGKR